MVGAFLSQDSEITVSMRQASLSDSITFAGKKKLTLKKRWKISCRDEIDETHSEIG